MIGDASGGDFGYSGECSSGGKLLI